ncbi:unnamed protein product [Phytophthora lilii]|uniref:Unnamed protein product n=1 Tax=Phytophthora lilii TaxID=2077276 RepID=A0A9W6U013_9STRA|nr:unnamed protein product [Phytophthora lilii]
MVRRKNANLFITTWRRVLLCPSAPSVYPYPHDTGLVSNAACFAARDMVLATRYDSPSVVPGNQALLGPSGNPSVGARPLNDSRSRNDVASWYFGRRTTRFRVRWAGVAGRSSGGKCCWTTVSTTSLEVTDCSGAGEMVT